MSIRSRTLSLCAIRSANAVRDLAVVENVKNKESLIKLVSSELSVSRNQRTVKDPVASFYGRTWYPRLLYYLIASCLGIKFLSSNECCISFEVGVHESHNQAYLRREYCLDALHLRQELFQRNIYQIYCTYCRHEGRTHFQHFTALRQFLQFV